MECMDIITKNVTKYQLITSIILLLKKYVLLSEYKKNIFYKAKPLMKTLILYSGVTYGACWGSKVITSLKTNSVTKREEEKRTI